MIALPVRRRCRSRPGWAQEALGPRISRMVPHDSEKWPRGEAQYDASEAARVQTRVLTGETHR
jgi:hypothetical protein